MLLIHTSPSLTLQVNARVRWFSHYSRFAFGKLSFLALTAVVVRNPSEAAAAAADRYTSP